MLSPPGVPGCREMLKHRARKLLQAKQRKLASGETSPVAAGMLDAH